MDKLRMGFIGVGRITDLHYLGYKDNPKAELHAVCDVDPVGLQRRVSQWGVEKAYDDYRRLLDDPDVDAVEVITPHHLHAEMTIAALEAGKHVSVQKPMALNLTQADAMMAAAGRSGKLLRIIENYRYYAPFNKAKQLIESGEIGEPLSIRIKSLSGNVNQGWKISQTSKEWRSDKSRSGAGSIVFDHGYHIWSVARYFLGDVERVFAFFGRRKVESNHLEIQSEAFMDNPVMVTWKYTGQDKFGCWDCVDSQDMMVRTKYYPMEVFLEITGSRGMLWVNRCTGQMLDRPPVELYRDGVVTGYSDIDADYGNSVARGVRDFVDAILEGRPSGLTGLEAREVLRFALAVVLSGKERREVCLDEITD